MRQHAPYSLVHERPWRPSGRSVGVRLADLWRRLSRARRRAAGGSGSAGRAGDAVRGAVAELQDAHDRGVTAALHGADPATCRETDMARRDAWDHGFRAGRRIEASSGGERAGAMASSEPGSAPSRAGPALSVGRARGPDALVWHDAVAGGLVGPDGADHASARSASRTSASTRMRTGFSM